MTTENIEDHSQNQFSQKKVGEIYLPENSNTQN